jgi:hypothetical protein
MDGCLEHEDAINVGLIPIQELEELEKEWNEAAEVIKTDETIDAPGYERALSKANSELRELIEKYE